MGIETASYITELNVANPTGSDLRSTSDNHHRLVKTVLKTQFPNLSATAVNSTVAELNLLSGVTSLSRIIEHGVVASTSGTEVAFTAIPAGVRRITMLCSDVSTDGSEQIILQLGDGGGYENAGYSGTYAYLRNVTAVSVSLPITGFVIANPPSASSEFNASITLTLVDSSTNTWEIGYTASSSAIPFTTITGAGAKSLTAELDRVRITGVLSASTFDAGKVNLYYE